MDRTKRMRRGAPALALLLCFCLLFPAASAWAADAAEETAGAAETAEAFHGYAHDPRLNPKAMADIVVDPEAVYGFSPSPEGSLKDYVGYDWSDPALVNGENGRLARVAYHESIAEMYTMVEEMIAAGSGIEEIARAACTKRNEIRLAAYANDPEGLASAKARNLERYGDENGGSPDYFYAQYGSWEAVLDKAFSTNSGMDACLGLYDDYYALYLALGQIAPESETTATREYAVALLMDAWTGAEPAEASVLDAFTDADSVSAWYAPELASAVSAGVLTGYEDAALRPGEGIRFIEWVVVLSRCLSAWEEDEAVELPFTDIPAWAEAETLHLCRIGFLVDDGDGLMNPYRYVSVENVIDWLSAATVFTAGE